MGRKRDPSRLPKTFESRVFVGGNYDHAATLRKICRYVDRCQGFHSIFPLDDLNIPLDQIHDWDLRVLHQCKYAVFEVTEPAGELMEIERTHEFKTKTLLLWQARESTSGKTEEPPKVRTMLLQSGDHEMRGYANDAELRNAIHEFLAGKDPELFRRLMDAYGYKFGRITSEWSVEADGSATEVRRYENLEVISGRSAYEIQHEFWTSGKIVKFAPNVHQPGNWEEATLKRAKGCRSGVVSFAGGLPRTRPHSYSFTIQFKNAVAIRRNQLPSESQDQLVTAGHEYVGLHINYPVEELRLRVRLGCKIASAPEAVAFLAKERRDTAITVPPDSYRFSRNLASLAVKRPLPFHRYLIHWEVPG